MKLGQDLDLRLGFVAGQTPGAIPPNYVPDELVD
jgi:hypothetical protein